MDKLNDTLGDKAEASASQKAKSEKREAQGEIIRNAAIQSMKSKAKSGSETGDNSSTTTTAAEDAISDNQRKRKRRGSETDISLSITKIAEAMEVGSSAYNSVELQQLQLQREEFLFRKMQYEDEQQQKASFIPLQLKEREMELKEREAKIRREEQQLLLQAKQMELFTKFLDRDSSQSK